MSSVARHENNAMFHMIADPFSVKGKAQRLEPVIADAHFAQQEGANRPSNPPRQRIYTVERPPVRETPVPVRPPSSQTTPSQTAPSQKSSSRSLMYSILIAVALLVLSILALVLLVL